MLIYCCECATEVEAVLTKGKALYPHRCDLWNLKFWRCPTCANFVGTHHRHHDASKRLDPLGVIANQEMKDARKHIHRLLDPMWKRAMNSIPRKRLYKMVAERLGIKEYHTAELRTIEDARRAWKAIKAIERDHLS